MKKRNSLLNNDNEEQIKKIKPHKNKKQKQKKLPNGPFHIYFNLKLKTNCGNNCKSSQTKFISTYNKN